MRIKTIITILAIALLTAGCSSEKKSAELLDTARFEEKQNNTGHAVKLYEEIIQKYPDSAAAKNAKTRLEELKKKP
jgi:TolA-binding protein